MTAWQAVSSPDAPVPSGPYSQAARAGDFVFLAGQTAREPGVAFDGSVTRKQQCRQVLRNLAALANAAGGSLADVVKVTVYLADLTWKQAFDEAYRECSQLAAARTTVCAAPPTGSVEVDAVLYLPMRAQ